MFLKKDMTYLRPQCRNIDETFPKKRLYTSFESGDEVYQPKLKNGKFKHAGRMVLANKFPFVDTTTYREQFTTPTKKAILNPEIKSFHILQYNRVDIPFEGQSRYKQEFKDSEFMEEIRYLNSQKINQKKQWNRGNNQLNSLSTYNVDYRPRRLLTGINSKQQRQIVFLPSLRFQGKTTYQNDYNEFKILWKGQSDRCQAQFLPIPSFNNINNGNHIYYDSISKRFA